MANSQGKNQSKTSQLSGGVNQVMEGRQTRNKGSKGTSKSSKTVESFREGEQAQVRPVEIGKDSTFGKMHDMEEIGKVLDHQIVEYRQFLRERDEIKAETKRRKEAREIERFQMLGREISHVFNQASDKIVAEMKRAREGREHERGRIMEKLPYYDGTNLDVIEWEEKVLTVANNNGWGFSRLIEALPLSLLGKAKMAFEALSFKDKQDEKTLFLGLRNQIQPQVESNYKTLFRSSSKEPSETISAYINRLRMYTRRSGFDPGQPVIEDMLQHRVFECVSSTNRKLLRATISQGDNLDKIISKADFLLIDEKPSVGGPKLVTPTNEIGVSQQNFPSQFFGMCGKCHIRGHSRKFCPLMAQNNTE